MKRLTGAVALALALPTCALAAPASQESTHVVAPGETLNGIANRAGVSPDALARANGLEPPYVVRLGQSLTIPRSAATTRAAAPKAAPAREARTYTVTSGETLNGIANRTGVSPAELARANGLAEPYGVRIGQTLTIPGTQAPKAPSAPAPTSQPAPEFKGETYLVKSGETLGGVAQRTGVARVLIAEANGLEPPYVLKVGQRLAIPRTRRHTVAKGDSGFSIALEYGVPWDAIAVASGIEPDASVRPGQELVIPSLVATRATPAAATATTAPKPAAPAPSTRFLWPVKGPINRGFKLGSDYHDGLDIKAARGTMVRAAAAGTVRFAGLEKEQFGNLVVIDHGGDWFTAYAFLSRITVKNGTNVAKGERIGLVGDTGEAKGNELHFEIRHDGAPVNPVDELPKAP
ncbi:LysM peptidoglycan-binding domain-containing M23 family metallopeptidase [Novosphingobium decolorationis]|uniref:LysM peptidoglycan-binding domain-containing M23 family metallopeptidase n=1 Tax=Novosphingobium decolorationis TaxID=2698673 RepID=A0ABX8E2S0_9SPHN|nr:LysM peptidoglycan-binding domain-containing M23 family metallopeptidase [Novosphingobium decolorationis]QVM83432.1 LysM peptidoglycan-binding domain-containing M23 family metallopeptidase [Novosphingobium decolorationis]